MREELAGLMHEIWAHWMTYLFEQCVSGPSPGWSFDAVISEELVERWKRQMGTPYDALSEKEKDSDRRQADKVLALIERHKESSMELLAGFIENEMAKLQ